MTLIGSREDLAERVEVRGAAGINGVVLQKSTSGLVALERGHSEPRIRAVRADR